MSELETQKLGTIARLSNVSTSEQVESYVNAKVIDLNYIHMSGDSNIGTLELSGDLSANSISSLKATFGYNNISELCSVAEGSTNHAISKFSHAEGDGDSYAGSNSFTIVTISTDRKTITLDTDISEIALSDELVIQSSGESVLTKITSIDVETKTIVLEGKVGQYTVVGNYVMVMHKPWLGTATKGDGAHVEGYSNMAFEDAHAENIFNAAYGKYSHCHGNANKAGWMATAFGSGNSALGKGSIAIGGNTNTQGKYAVCDTNAIVKGANSFAWSGNGKYEVTTNGTFNINPIGGTKGFYIGKEPLFNILSSSQSNALSNVEFDTSKSTNIDYLASMLSTVISAFGGKII